MRMPAIRATRGWITTISRVIGCNPIQRVLGEGGGKSGKYSYGRLPVQQGTLSYYGCARRGALLPLPNVPAGSRRSGSLLAYRTASRLHRDDGHPTRLPFLGEGRAAFLRRLRHAADLARDRQPAAR